MLGKQILLVDDEPLVGQSVKLLLQLDGHTVEYVGDARTALERYAPGKYDLVLTDSRMPEMSGLELAEKIRQQNPAQRIMMLTGYPPNEQAPFLDLIMLKPFSGADLRSAVAKLTQA
jgi:CheY-like chemotaxis protein